MPSKPTTKPARGRGGAASPDETKRELLDAAFDTLRSDGFRGASARAIANRAGCNQAAIYYHFGGIDELLVAALHRSSAARLELYEQQIGPLTTLGPIIDELERLYRADRDSGHLLVLSELMGGVTAKPELAAGINAAVGPWTEFVTARIELAASTIPYASLLPAAEVADLLLSVVVGIELRIKLDDDTERATRLFRVVAAAVNLLPDA